MALIRQENIREIYFTDHPARSWAYILLRCTGVSGSLEVAIDQWLVMAKAYCFLPSAY